MLCSFKTIQFVFNYTLDQIQPLLIKIIVLYLFCRHWRRPLHNLQPRLPHSCGLSLEIEFIEVAHIPKPVDSPAIVRGMEKIFSRLRKPQIAYSAIKALNIQPYHSNTLLVNGISSMTILVLISPNQMASLKDPCKPLSVPWKKLMRLRMIPSLTACVEHNTLRWWQLPRLQNLQPKSTHYPYRGNLSDISSFSTKLDQQLRVSTSTGSHQVHRL